MGWVVVVPGRLTNGTVQVDDTYMRSQLVGHRNGDVLVTVEQARATRSTLQNAWYWSCVLGTIATETGQPVDDLHEFFRNKFNGKTLVLINGSGEIVGEERIANSTTRLSTITFSDYCEQIRQFAMDELGIYIPDADPNWRHAEAQTS